MKTVLSLVVGLCAATAIAAGVADLPPCGQICVNNMLGKAGELGCSASDAKCLCANNDFTNGIRDCSYEYCQDDNAAKQVVDFGTQYCAGAGVTVATTPYASSTGTGGGAGGSSESGGGGGGDSSTPVSTAAVVTTISTDGSMVTSTVGSTTLYSVVSDASGSASSALSSASGSLSSASESAASSISGAASSLSSAVSSASSSARASSSSSAGIAPKQTAAPVGLLAAAGIAALML